MVPFELVLRIVCSTNAHIDFLTSNFFFPLSPFHDKMEYRAMHQTWTMVRPFSTSIASDAKETTHEESKTRHRFQRLRISKRCSIASLAAIIKCDADTLAAYERGDELLDKETLLKLERCLSS